MQGIKTYQREMFLCADLEKLVPQDHPLRSIDRVVNLSFIREMTEPLYRPGTGRPSIDPVMFFRMELIAYLFGVPSDRQLCREVQVNLAYRWFLRMSLMDEVPSHSSLTRIRDRLGEDTIKAIFERLVTACQKAGLLKGQRIMVDATLVKANASIESLAENVPGGKAPDRKQYPSYKKSVRGYDEGDRKPRYSNDTHTSTTDADAKMVSRSDGYRRLFHKAHFSLDADSRIVTDCHVTSGNVLECTTITNRIEYQLKTFGFPLQEVIADRGYSSGNNYAYFAARGIRTYIPCFPRGKGHAKKQFFKFDRAEDQYICPMGEALERAGVLPERNLVSYAAKKGQCFNCEIKKDCFGNGAAKRIHRHFFEDEISKVVKRMPTAAFKRRGSERFWKAEGIIAEAKMRCGLIEARSRGRRNVQIQAYFTAIVQNMKRVAKTLRVGNSANFSCRKPIAWV